MSQIVNILLPSGHRKNNKVSPNTVVSQTLIEVCRKANLDSRSYSFQFRGKILDESLSWRFANVPNNAKLELVQHEKSSEEVPVRIALQYEGGSRLQGNFLPSSSLFDILIHWKSDLSTLNPPEGHEPSIVYLRQEIIGLSKLEKVTLKSLGLTKGSAVLRLSYKLVTHVADGVKNSSPERKNEKTQPATKSIPVEKKLAPKWPMQEKLHRPDSSSVHTTQIATSASSSDVIITQEMLQKALEHVSHTDVEMEQQNCARSSSSDVSMETASSSAMMEYRDVMDDGPKNGRARLNQPISTEMPKKKAKHSSSREQLDFSNFKFPEETAGMEIYTAEDESEIDISLLTKPCDRETIFFDERDVENLTLDDDDPGDEFFELTVSDIQKMIGDLRSVQNESDEKPLLTAKSRELQRLRSLNQYPKIVARIVFPNRKIVQGFFRPAEKVETLYKFVETFLSSKTEFYLYTTPPKVILKDKSSLLFDNHLAPASKVFFGLKSGNFSPELLSKKCNSLAGSIADANLKLGKVLEMKSPLDRRREQSHEFALTQNDATLSGSDVQSTSGVASSSAVHPSGARPKVPKWFKVGK